MSALSKGLLRTSLRSGGALHTSASASAKYGRSPAYRRIAAFHDGMRPHTSPTKPIVQPLPVLSSIYLPDALRPSLASFSRQVHSTTLLWQQAPKEDIKDSPREEQQSSSSSSQEQQNQQQEQQNGDQEKEDQQGERKGEQKEEQKEEKQEKSAPPPHGDKSPWQVFTETLSSEFKASKEWNESTKALSGQVQDFTQNENMQRVRKGYAAASDAASSTTGRILSGTGRAIGQSAAWTWDTTPVKGLRVGANATGRVMEKATRPLRETEAFKSVANVIDDGSSSRYGGWSERDERRAKRDRRESEEVKRTGRPRQAEKVEEDPNAGTNVTLHKDAAWKESWRKFRETSPLFGRIDSMKTTYAESENPLISTARSITDRFAGFFAENETATVIKAFRSMDPKFQLETFLQDMREYILPEVLDAYVKGDVEILKMWLSEAQFQVYSALMRQYTTAGLKSDGRILDIRNVDVLNARMLEPSEIPVFILSARTQEVHVYRNAKSGDLAAGMEDKVQQVTYAIGLTRLPEEVNNPETRGWRLIELQKSSRDFY
ncbi:MAG: hypothetical protein Q9162_006027 [Coniocarpon cinnabarinum]